MNCIVIDDDLVIQVLMEKYLSKIKGLNLIGVYSNPMDVINEIPTLEPIHLVFLDIQLPDMNGIDLIQYLSVDTLIIVISGEEKYAIKAIENNVIDYILKPITYPRLLKAISRAQKRFLEKKTPINQENDEIFIKTQNRYIRILFEDILWVKAIDKSITIATTKNEYEIKNTLKNLGEKLPEALFYRIHRSYLVNIRKIEFVLENSVVIQRNNKPNKIPVARNVKNDLIKRLNIL